MGILSRFFEKRSTLQQPADWLKQSLGVTDTLAGITVGPEQALTLASYFAAVRCIAEDCGKLPLIVYKRLEPRGKMRAADSPVYSLLHDSPNKSMTAIAFRETLTAHAITWGNGLAEIVRNEQGTPTSLWPLDPSRTKIEADPKTGDVKYTTRSKDAGSEIVLQAPDVLHIHGLGFDGITGYSVAHLARESIGYGLAVQRFGSSYFGNGTHLGNVLSFQGGINQKVIADLREQIEKQRQGIANAHRFLILQHGAEIRKLGVPPDDSQFIESAQFSVEELCRWLRISPIKLQHLLRATYDNVTEENRAYVTDTLQPWLTRWEQEIARKLLPREGGQFAEHLVEGLLRGNPKERAEFYQILVRNRIMTPNEVRERENLNPLPGGDELLPDGNPVLGLQRV